MSGLRSNLALGPCIGGGYFGDVYLSNDEVQGEVAVKVLRKRADETDLEWQTRKTELLHEGQRLSQARHRNVVAVHYLAEDDCSDAVFLVMEYCRGGSLQNAFDSGPLPLNELRKLTTDIAFGLHALHARGMLHRDIKPGNLLYDANGVGKLGDFGLVTENLVFGYASQAGYSDHLAPEIWNGSGTSVRTDIWALGMTLYRLLHGAEWYSGLPSPTLNVGNGGFADTLPWLPHIPKDWRRFVRRFLRDDPNMRFQNANQITEALSKLEIGTDWSCTVTAPEVRWERETKTRRIFVVWTRRSPRRHEWEAWSEPIDTGRRRTLAGSKKILGRAETHKQLSAFLQK